MYRTDQEILLDGIKTVSSKGFSPKGSKLIADTTTHTGPFYAITILEDTVFTAGSMTDSDVEGLDATSFVAGITLMGSFPQIALTSGKVVAYKS